MANKMEVVKNWDGEVLGYTLGEYYLGKYFYWNNDYAWLIVHNNDMEKVRYSNSYDRNKLSDAQRIIYPTSCRNGKDILRALSGGAEFNQFVVQYND